MNFEFHPEAEQGLLEIALRYASGVPVLGRRFVDEVERVVQLLLEHSDLSSRLDDDLRHFILKKFPFSIVYATGTDLNYMVAVAHGSREPDY